MMTLRFLALSALALAFVGCGGDAAAPSDGGEALKVDFPKPQFVGTPLPQDTSKYKNLDNSGKPVETLNVPKGTTLLSKGKPVTSSETNPTIGDNTLITDSSKEGADGCFVEFGPGEQWAQVDLGASANIAAVCVWHYHKQSGRIYNDVIIQASDDAEFKTGVTTIYNNDDDDSQKKGAGADKTYIETNHGRLMAAKGAKGRYVRCYSNGSNVDELNHYIEIEVFGTPAK
jgi:hypothetical protein